METKVNKCSECPFLYSVFDEYSTKCNTMDVCVLTKKLELRDFIIGMRDLTDEVTQDIPEFCPLRVEDIIVKLYKDDEK